MFEELMSETAIVVNLTKVTLQNSTINWIDLTVNYDLIRNIIEAAIPGFENFHEKIRIKKEAKVYLARPYNISQHWDKTTILQQILAVIQLQKE